MRNSDRIHFNFVEWGGPHFVKIYDGSNIAYETDGYRHQRKAAEQLFNFSQVAAEFKK